MKEMIMFNESLSDYIDDQLYSLESYDSEFEDSCEVYQELYDAYINEVELYQEGDILDTATGAGKNENIIVRILLFIPRFLYAIGKAAYNKITDKKIEQASDVVEAAVNVAEGSASEDTVVEAVKRYKLSHRKFSGSRKKSSTGNTGKDPFEGVEEVDMKDLLDDNKPGDITDNIGDVKRGAKVSKNRSNRQHSGRIPRPKYASDFLNGNNQRNVIKDLPLTDKQRGIGKAGTDVPSTRFAQKISVDREYYYYIKSCIDICKDIIGGNLHTLINRMMTSVSNGTRTDLSGSMNELLDYFTDKRPSSNRLLNDSGIKKPFIEFGRTLLKARDDYFRATKVINKEAVVFKKSVETYTVKHKDSRNDKQTEAVRRINEFHKSVIIPFFTKLSLFMNEAANAIGNAMMEYAAYIQDVVNVPIIPDNATPETVMRGPRNAPLNDLGRGEGVIELGTSKKSNKPNASNKPNKSTNKPNKSTNKPNKSKSFVNSVKRFFQNSYYDEFDDNDETFVESYLI